ncbi:hypothetical protein OESDEN_05182 [Oesophagostomum dentatum]|uniref:Uncharacterized protein n=1 Tax=Oesophagostomum dentatum TaxID=61180 RepID=A0A0B1TC63_OESDE|nr:hypothetical protein OESDEN_05182 [Oesophagostomum dentatum]
MLPFNHFSSQNILFTHPAFSTGSVQYYAIPLPPPPPLPLPFLSPFPIFDPLQPLFVMPCQPSTVPFLSAPMAFSTNLQQASQNNTSSSSLCNSTSFSEQPLQTKDRKKEAPKFLGAPKVSDSSRTKTILYRIPGTATTYTFKMDKEQTGEVKRVVCTGCLEKGKETSIEVKGMYFLSDPCKLDHVCVPQKVKKYYCGKAPVRVLQLKGNGKIEYTCASKSKETERKDTFVPEVVKCQEPKKNAVPVKRKMPTFKQEFEQWIGENKWLDKKEKADLINLSRVTEEQRKREREEQKRIREDINRRTTSMRIERSYSKLLENSCETADKEEEDRLRRGERADKKEKEDLINLSRLTEEQRKREREEQKRIREDINRRTTSMRIERSYSKLLENSSDTAAKKRKIDYDEERELSPMEMLEVLTNKAVDDSNCVYVE